MAPSTDKRRSARLTLKRSVVPMLLVAAGYYAVFGGGSSVWDLLETRANVVVEETRLEEARVKIDSLEVELQQLKQDAAMIERIAREQFGMIREGEVLYRFTPTTSEGQRTLPPAR